MAGDDSRAYRAAVADRLRLISCRAVWPDERGDVPAAAWASGVDPAVDHPLADLYRVLRLSVISHRITYLSCEHCELLTEAIRQLAGRAVTVTPGAR
jgi:hypothetical protein